jgi:hypothetical protein
MPVPIALVPVDARILSSYVRTGGTNGPREVLRPLAQLGKAGVCTADTAAALLALHEAVQAAGGDFRVTELHRDVAVQQAARAKYDRWVRAGKPKPGTSGFDANTMKAAFVATPGRSMHNAGRALDVNLAALKFPGVAADKQLDKLWELARACGWSPVIRTADERASEAWHFDCWGDLRGVYARLGYEQAAFAGALLVGHAGTGTSWASVTQALLQRAGHNIGAIDGAFGPRSVAALAAALGSTTSATQGLVARADESIWPRLAAMPAA